MSAILDKDSLLSEVKAYIGKKWEAGARGPETFDCYGLIYDFYKHHMGLEIDWFPVMPSDTKEICKLRDTALMKRDWFIALYPQCFDVIGMGKKHYTHHFGLWLDVDGGLVLHANEGTNVIAQKLSQIKKEFRTIEFYRHADHS